MIGAELAQREVELVEERTPRAVAVDAVAALDQPGLAGEHDAAAHVGLVDQRAEQLLAHAVAIDRRRVDERAAGVEERRQLLLGVVGVDGRAPRHGAEREP